jgi:prolyl oligopeptidase
MMEQMMMIRTMMKMTLALGLMAASCTGERPDEQPKESTMRYTPASYPATRQDPIKDTLHGVEVSDPYRWLEDVSQPEVKAWMAAQDAATDAALGALPARAALIERYNALYYIDAITAPRNRKGRYFYAKRKAGQEKYVYYWRQGDAGEEHVLLDPNTLSEDGSISVGGVYSTRDGERVAYKLKENNADESTMYVMDVKTGKTSDADVITGAKYAYPVWTPDGQGFYYVHLPQEEGVSVQDRPGLAEVRYHKLGTKQEADPLVFARTGDPKMFLGVDLSYDGRYLFLYKQLGWTSVAIYYKDLQAKPAQADWKAVVEGKDAKFDLTAWGDDFYILTDDGAPRGRVVKVPASSGTYADAKEIIAESGSVIEGVQVVGGKLVVTRMESAYSKMTVHGLDGAKLADVELPGIGVTSGMVGDPSEPEAYYTFTSFTTPPQIYRTDVTSGQTALWAKVEVPIDPSALTVEQVFYTSKDGEKISMFLIHKKGLKRDGQTPFILYGYGGFSVSLSPYFRSDIYPWLEAGGGFAVPNLRGGGEYGEDWHRSGMLDKKQNVFDDFIAAAEYLIAQRYTSAEHLGISGGSNGGLLVGAVMVQRPELFRAVACAVPLLDMVRYHLFGSGKTWISEYGSAEDAAQFKALYAYSPYHHVKPGTKYPATLMLSADSDDRVDPMHARKMAAALQAASTSGLPVWLRIEENAGHGGGDMVKKRVAHDAETYGFFMQELGLTPAR